MNAVTGQVIQRRELGKIVIVTLDTGIELFANEPGPVVDSLRHVAIGANVKARGTWHPDNVGRLVVDAWGPA